MRLDILQGHCIILLLFYYNRIHSDVTQTTCLVSFRFNRLIFLERKKNLRRLELCGSVRVYSIKFYTKKAQHLINLNNFYSRHIEITRSMGSAAITSFDCQMRESVCPSATNIAMIDVVWP